MGRGLGSRWSSIWLGGLAGLAIAAPACNAISGVGEYDFDLAPPSTSQGGRGGGGGANGGGGAGGGGGSEVMCDPPCDEPPTDCFDPAGTCVAGECEYEPLPADTICDDGDPCTEGDACDGMGQCVPGPECPNLDPCLDVTCDPMAGCVTSPKADGASCGALASERCCGGVCVDVSSDDDHCGGCGYACAPGRTCESIGLTTQCPLSPADTSGRCTCGGNMDCPVGQVCRTVAPVANRCAPENQADCPGTTFVDQVGCPNHCAY